MSTKDYVRCYGCKQLVETVHWICPDCGTAIGEVISLTMYEAELTRYVGFSFLAATVAGIAALAVPGVFESTAAWLAPVMGATAVIGGGFLLLGRKMTPRLIRVRETKARSWTSHR